MFGPDLPTIDEFDLLSIHPPLRFSFFIFDKFSLIYSSGSQPFETRGPLMSFETRSRTNTENCVTDSLAHYNNNNNTQLVTRHMSVNAYSYIYERTESQALCYVYLNIRHMTSKSQSIEHTAKQHHYSVF